MCTSSRNLYKIFVFVFVLHYFKLMCQSRKLQCKDDLICFYICLHGPQNNDSPPPPQKKKITFLNLYQKGKILNKHKEQLSHQQEDLNYCADCIILLHPLRTIASDLSTVSVCLFVCFQCCPISSVRKSLRWGHVISFLCPSVEGCGSWCVSK